MRRYGKGGRFSDVCGALLFDERNDATRALLPKAQKSFVPEPAFDLVGAALPRWLPEEPAPPLIFGTAPCPCIVRSLFAGGATNPERLANRCVASPSGPFRRYGKRRRDP